MRVADSELEAPGGPVPNATNRDGLRVEVRSLSMSFGDFRALDNVDLTVSAGEMVVLLGPSGCGKTTLLRSIAGLLEPQAGEIRLDGRKVYSAADRLWLPPERRNLNMVFQSYALWPHMTLAQNVAYPLECRRVDKAATARRVEEVLAVVGLNGLGARLPAQLSGGQQQRAALARAIAPDVNLILFDEPLSNVDAKVRDQIRREIVELQRRFGFAAVYVTHDQVEACALADRLVIMDHGRIAAVGRPDEIYDSPSSLYVARFLGSTNEITGGLRQEGGSAVVDTPIGPVVGGLRNEDAAGSGTAIFRLEACQLSRTELSGPNVWPCRIHRSALMGATNEVSLALGKDDAIAWSAMVPRGAYREGDVVWLHVPPQQVWIYAEG